MTTEGTRSPTVVELAEGMAAGQTTSVDAVQACLDRVEAVDGTINAFVHVQAEQALEVASALDRMREAGHVLGPLHGVPVAIKDNLAQAGRPNPAGSSILAEETSRADASAVARLRRSGAVVLGRLNMHEFAQGVTTDNPHHGPTRNPWALDRSPGGSSGGSGAAVAAREVPAALGTDTGCSVRLPAAFNGVTGLRPTLGRVSNHGVTPLAWSMDTVGPLAQSAADCGVVLRAIAGQDREDPATSERSVVGGGSEPANLRIAVLRPSADRPVEQSVQAALDVAIGVLAGVSVVVEEVEIEGLEHAITALKIVNMAEPAGTHGRWVRTRAQEYGTDLRTLMDGAELFFASHYVQADRYRSFVSAQLEKVLQRFDVIVTPTVEFGAPPLGAEEITLPGGRQVDVISGVLRYNSLPSLTGLPALSLPVGFTEAGLPAGMQVIGRAFEEHVLLALGEAYQERTTWHREIPDLLGGSLARQARS